MPSFLWALPILSVLGGIGWRESVLLWGGGEAHEATDTGFAYAPVSQGGGGGTALPPAHIKNSSAKIILLTGWSALAPPCHHLSKAPPPRSPPVPGAVRLDAVLPR